MRHVDIFWTCCFFFIFWSQVTSFRRRFFFVDLESLFFMKLYCFSEANIFKFRYNLLLPLSSSPHPSSFQFRIPSSLFWDPPICLWHLPSFLWSPPRYLEGSPSSLRHPLSSFWGPSRLSISPHIERIEAFSALPTQAHILLTSLLFYMVRIGLKCSSL